PPWDSLPLARGPAHNLITPWGGDQATSIGRFLFVPWPRARVVRRTPETIQAEFDKPTGGIQRWTRLLMRLADDAWCVVDHVRMLPESRMQLHWHLAPFPDVTANHGLAKTLRTPEGDYTMAVAFENTIRE